MVYSHCTVMCVNDLSKSFNLQSKLTEAAETHPGFKTGSGASNGNREGVRECNTAAATLRVARNDRAESNFTSASTKSGDVVKKSQRSQKKSSNLEKKSKSAAGDAKEASIGDDNDNQEDAQNKSRLDDEDGDDDNGPVKQCMNVLGQVRK